MSNFSYRRMVLSCLLAAIPSGLYAVDGVILIDQNHALAGNVTAGDAPGFPVTISQPGSYRLSGNLTVPDTHTSGIVITADYVTIDLNGFSIIGPVVCTGSPAACPAAAEGTGIQAGVAGVGPGPRSTRISNGTVRGMGNFGLVLIGPGDLVERVTADSNSGGGMIVAGSAIESAGTLNGGFGILAITVRDCITTDNKREGILLDGSGGVATGNIASFNGTQGIRAPNGTVIGNTTVRNAGFGISALCPSVLANNTSVSNTAGAIDTSPTGCALLNNATR